MSKQELENLAPVLALGKHNIIDEVRAQQNKEKLLESQRKELYDQLSDLHASQRRRAKKFGRTIRAPERNGKPCFFPDRPHMRMMISPKIAIILIVKAIKQEDAKFKL